MVRSPPELRVDADADVRELELDMRDEGDPPDRRETGDPLLDDGLCC